MKHTLRGRPTDFGSQSGISILETLIALTILVIVMAGVMPLAMIATGSSENQGHLTARAAEYAQDKMEQLLALSYTDTVTDTSQGLACTPSSTPACNSGTGLAIGGGTDPSNPVTGYVDYLDSSGNILASSSGAPSGWFYIRVWKVSQTSTNLKNITITAKVKSQIGSPQGALPRATVASLKANPF